MQRVHYLVLAIYKCKSENVNIFSLNDFFYLYAVGIVR